MTMIEKICRAMCKEEGVDPDHSVRDSYGIMADDKAWMTYEHLAIAAINAMKDPTDEMAEDGFEEGLRLLSHDAPTYGEVLKIYVAMINAALSEHKNTETV